MSTVMNFLAPYAKQGCKLVMDSRKVSPGDVFIAVKGQGGDGHLYIDDAVAAGAAGIVHGPGHKVASPGIASLEMDNLANGLGTIANAFYSSPSEGMKVVAVTGTKGKTTTAYWCSQLLGQAGYIGTLGAGSQQAGLAPTGMTTPNTLEMHALLAGFVKQKINVAVIEASSHGLEQNRLAGVDCDVAVFTNLGSDHLEYHGNERNYFSSKLKLFSRSEIDTAVINMDDPRASEVVFSCACEILTCGSSSDCDISWSLADNASKGVLVHRGKSAAVSLPMPGVHNLSNAGLAVAAALAAGASWDHVAERLSQLSQLPGRLELIKDIDRIVYVDFAHTTEAIRAALGALRAAYPTTRLTCVFGCGGDRDKSKRPLMGAAASELADKVIITSDNPRGEDPGQIADEIAAGSPGAQIALDRTEALELALSQAEPGEVILVAGKGDEAYMEIAGKREPYSDRETVRKLLEKS